VMTCASLGATRPRYVVCEDGREYIERFERFLGADFDFVSASDYATLLARLEQDRAICGILLDLDFRRAEKSQLVDERGQSVAHLGQQALSQYTANQGIFILASLRERGIVKDVLLFADIDGAQHATYLTRTFAPVELIPSHVGLKELKERLLSLAGRYSSTQ